MSQMELEYSGSVRDWWLICEWLEVGQWWKEAKTSPCKYLWTTCSSGPTEKEASCVGGRGRALKAAWDLCPYVMSQEAGLVKGAWPAQLKLLQHLSGSLGTDSRAFCSGKRWSGGKVKEIQYRPERNSSGIWEAVKVPDGKPFHCVQPLPVQPFVFAP